MTGSHAVIFPWKNVNLWLKSLVLTSSQKIPPIIPLTAPLMCTPLMCTSTINPAPPMIVTTRSNVSATEFRARHPGEKGNRDQVLERELNNLMWDFSWEGVIITFSTVRGHAWKKWLFHASFLMVRMVVRCRQGTKKSIILMLLHIWTGFFVFHQYKSELYSIISDCRH